MSGPHIVPVRIYVAVFLALMAFTAVTVAAALVDLGAMNNVVMLGIAVTKATLVVLFFMHVRYSTRLIPVVVLCGVFFLLVMIGITMSDYVSRGFLGAGSPWPRPWAP
jgi:cytochrome c oxidase subunit 4